MTTPSYRGYKVPTPSRDLSAGEWALVVGVVVALIAAVIAFLGFLTMLGWNYGAVALIAACGGTAAKIGLGAGICVNLALAALSRVFRGARATASTSD